MNQQTLSEQNERPRAQNCITSVFLIFQQPPFSCPFVRGVVQEESAADKIINRLSHESSLYKFWKEKFEVL